MARSRAEALPGQVEEAMRVLARESPAHLAAVAEGLGALTVSIRVDDTPRSACRSPAVRPGSA